MNSRILWHLTGSAWLMPVVIAFFALTLAAPAPAAAAEMTIQLDDDEAAHIVTDEDAFTLTVTVSQNGELTTRVTLGNASFDPQDVREVVLCSGCDPTYFIPAWDRSSTYGSTTGLILWSDGWWSISILPLSVADIEGPDAEGVTTLTDTKHIDGAVTVDRFSFRNGRLF